MRLRKINWPVLTIIFCLGLIAISEAKAIDGVIWISTGEWSTHNNQDTHHFRQNNTGAGLEYDLDEDSQILFGYYNNSIYRESVYLGEAYTPKRIGDVKLGTMGAIVTGYSAEYPFVPIASLYASYEYKAVGINLMWLPSVVAAVQFKFKFRGW